MAAADYYDDVQKVYIAYYGRPADREGLLFWADKLNTANGNLSEIINAFGTSAEAEALFGGQTVEQMVSAIYEQLFNRLPDPEGLDFYSQGIMTGKFTLASVMLDVLNGAKNADVAIIDAKLAAADAFTDIFFDGQHDAEDVLAYSGDANAAIARDWLHDVVDTTTATAAEATIADTITEMTGNINGETFVLTDSLDEVSITALNTVDTVKGLIDYDGTTDNSTFSVGDSITGNGHTVLQLAVVDTDSTNYSAEFVEMSGIDAINVVAAVSNTLTLDASTYGTDISSIALSGKDGLEVNVDNLTVEGSLELSIDAAATGDITVDGTIDGLTINNFSVTNDDADSVGAVATIGTAGITFTLGENDNAYASIAQSVTATGAATVGDLTFGDITLSLGKDADASLSISNYADSTTKGAATVGDLIVGNVTLDIGQNASASVSLTNQATAASGAATVGSLTVGDIGVSVAKSGSQDWFGIYNSAESTKGAATAGDITLGNITATAADSASYVLYMSVYNSADANTSGNAKVGNITLGDVTITGGDNFDWGQLDVYNSASADKGTATVGNITAGDVVLDLGNNETFTGYFSLQLSNSAYVSVSGAATAGSITVGDITMNAGTDNYNSVSITNYAYTAKGAATVGDITVGNVSGTVGLDGDAYFEVNATADGTASDVVGNVTIGNIDFYGQPSATLSVSLEVSANAGSVGNISVGDVNMKVDGDGEISLYADIYAAKNVGDVTIGDVDLTLGSNASLSYFTVSVSANTGDLAGFTIGDVTITGALSASDDGGGIVLYAGDDVGDVTFGDFTLSVGKNGDFDSQTVEIDANTGNVGNIVMGNTTIDVAVSATAYRTFDVSADGEIGNITAGDVTLSAAKAGYIWASHEYSASDDMGDISYGDISVAANGNAAYAGFSLEADANGNTIGTVTVGNVDLTAAGESATASVSIWLSDTGDTVGLATIGDISLAVSNTATATAAAYVNFSMTSNGSITVGDITLAGGDVTADFVATAMNSADVVISTGNNLIVGDITVSGGQSNDDPAVLDNFAVLTSWLQLTETGSGSITVGDIDYSGYEAAATIDVSAWKGALHITAAQDDTVITDNKAQNIITLGDGDDTVNMDATTSTADKTSATAIDEIIGFTTLKDVLSINGSGSDFDYVSAAAADYAAFLTAAGAAMTNFGTDIYARAVGGDLYVAIDADAGGSVDFVVKLTGITSIDSGDIVIV